MTPLEYTFVDPDGDLLEVGFNYSFGHASITIFAEEGVRMTVDDAEKLIDQLQKLVDKAKRDTVVPDYSIPESGKVLLDSFGHGGHVACCDWTNSGTNILKDLESLNKAFTELVGLKHKDEQKQ